MKSNQGQVKLIKQELKIKSETQRQEVKLLGGAIEATVHAVTCHK